MFGKAWICDSPFSTGNYTNYMNMSSVSDKNSASKMRCASNTYKI